MNTQGGDEHIARFVLELLRTGYALTKLLAELIEALPTDACKGEEPAGVAFEMLYGTIATVLMSVDQRATQLIDLAAARTLEHLQLASALSQGIDSDAGLGPNYG